MRVAFVLAVCVWSVATRASALDQEETFFACPPQIEARGAVLIDRASGRVLYAQNADEQLPMASTTKVMTALLALENASLDETVTAGKNASGVPGTSIYLSEGEQLTMEQMLYGLLLRSGNDAAVAIAEHIGGSVENFARMMNERAQSLNAGAHFVNPNGLDAQGHAASALGMARIAAEALENADFRRIVSTPKTTIPWPGNAYQRVLENKNRLLREYEGATGVKTGFTNKAGRCLIFSAERDGMELVGVLLNCGTWFDSAKRLLDWGFENYHAQTMFEQGQTAAQLSVSGGLEKRIDAVYEKRMSIALAGGETALISLEVDQPLRAPIREGDIVGRALLTVDGQTQAWCYLRSGATVGQANFVSALAKAASNWPSGFRYLFE